MLLGLCLNLLSFFHLESDNQSNYAGINCNKAFLSIYTGLLLQYGFVFDKFGTTNYLSVYILVSE